MNSAELLGSLTSVATDLLIDSGDVLPAGVDGVRPSIVVRPATATAAATLLRFASANRLAVVPMGGGSSLDLGNQPDRVDILLDLRELNRVIDYQPQDLTVRVEAGMTLGALQDTLAANKQMLALDPPLMERVTIGGLIAANRSGPRRLRFGTARDVLIGSRALLADGTFVRSGGNVVKNVAGYDLNKLWVGSLGTLAVLVEATLKVAPLPPVLAVVLAAFPNAHRAGAAALAVGASRLQPFSTAILHPAAVPRGSDGMATLIDAGSWLLAMEVGGTRVPVDRTTRELALLAKGAGAQQTSVLEGGQHETICRHVRDFGHTATDPAALILRASVMPGDVLRAIDATLDAAGAEPPAIVANAGGGTVYGFWGADAVHNGVAIATRLRHAIEPIGGEMTIERAPSIVKDRVDVWGLAGADVELMHRVKRAYDPDGILSPGRIFSEMHA